VAAVIPAAGRSGAPAEGQVEVGAVAANLATVRRRIEAAGGDPGRVTVVAVTKGFGLDAVSAALQAGLADLGENYGQELAAKAAAAPPGPTWHFLGPVQRNKVAGIARYVRVWQAVDRLAAGEAIARRQPGGCVLVQVKLGDEPGKHGCPPAEAPDLVARLRQLELDVRGLMAVGPTGEPAAARPGFRRLAVMASHLGLAELSMGMTADLEVAVEEGATMVRIGRALFGPRPDSVATIGSSAKGGD
jgi:pyridoxal phosphate enzyme (YggS family)